jgi:hypothetical protein
MLLGAFSPPLCCCRPYPCPSPSSPKTTKRNTLEQAEGSGAALDARVPQQGYRRRRPRAGCAPSAPPQHACPRRLAPALPLKAVRPLHSVHSLFPAAHAHAFTLGSRLCPRPPNLSLCAAASPGPPFSPHPPTPACLPPPPQAPPPSRRCCAPKASCGSPTPTPQPSTGPTPASTLRSGTRASGGRRCRRATGRRARRSGAWCCPTLTPTASMATVGRCAPALPPAGAYSSRLAAVLAERC